MDAVYLYTPVVNWINSLPASQIKNIEMETQHHTEPSVKKATADHSKMNHNGMQHGNNPPMGREGHDHHAMIDDFKKRFYVVLILLFQLCCYQL